jgi:hypothetical protein
LPLGPATLENEYFRNSSRGSESSARWLTLCGRRQGQFIAYYRVSTAKQGRSGLGLEAQKAAVLDFLNGGSWKLLGEFTEVESGKRASNRPELARATEQCRMTGAKLLIAKLDRLSWYAHFLLGLQRGAVGFVAADMPQANELTVGILAVVAQAERKVISDPPWRQPRRGERSWAATAVPRRRIRCWALRLVWLRRMTSPRGPGRR